MEAAVCSSHKDMMEAGEPWSLAAPGVVQMGMDIPPKLVSLRASDEPGSEQGFTLTMDLDAAGQPRTQSVWVSDAKAKDLLDLMKFIVGEK